MRVVSDGILPAADHPGMDDDFKKFFRIEDDSLECDRLSLMACNRQGVRVNPFLYHVHRFPLPPYSYPFVQLAVVVCQGQMAFLRRCNFLHFLSHQSHDHLRSLFTFCACPCSMVPFSHLSRHPTLVHQWSYLSLIPHFGPLVMPYERPRLLFLGGSPSPLHHISWGSHLMFLHIHPSVVSYPRVGLCSHPLMVPL